MTTETTKLKAKLASLTSSLDGLEATLAPLFAQTLPETTLALAPIEQAKLQTLLPYIVYDLVFIYLKSKGIDPKTHPVVGELTRVRKYFDKISAAENPETQRGPIDKAAATRFIKHAITQSKFGDAAAAAHASERPSEDATAPSTSTFVPVKITSKMLARAEHEAAIRAGDSSDEEEELEVIDGDAPVASSAKGKGKGKAKATEVAAEPVVSGAGAKRRRPVVDPFAGFGDEPAPESAQMEVDETPDEVEVETETTKRKTKKAKKSDAAADSTSAPTPDTPGTEKKLKRTPSSATKEKKSSKAKKADGGETPSPKKKAKTKK
ncbi:Sas10/Utp3/C1D family-domain-containing protein [Mycena albidolilacea]|uniref:Exosome complex protein n=1 Tax=Mycena albidolilacea TaxID=1033008 RepID=A0AAD7AK79_9AGAR|nr:Sas10/Utp3/C1D family-domain-containing protein [Mycena albidolilacea]